MIEFLILAGLIAGTGIALGGVVLFLDHLSRM